MVGHTRSSPRMAAIEAAASLGGSIDAWTVCCPVGPTGSGKLPSARKAVVRFRRCGRGDRVRQDQGAAARFEPRAAAKLGLALRAMTDSDLPFVAELYASTRRDELA